MASFSKRFVRFGVRIVGGCCGTTPAHIRAIKSAVKSVQPGASGAAQTTASAAQLRASGVAAPAISTEQKSRLAAKLARGQFVTMVDMIPPRGHEYHDAVERAKYLKAHDVDAITVTDAPRSSARMSGLSLALLLEKSTAIESLVHYACGDRNLLGMQADLLGAYALGLKNLLLITGDPPQTGDYPDATAVYDVDSIGLTNMVGRLNHGLDVGGKSIGAPTGFLIGVGCNPSAIDNEEELKRFYYKVEAGAEFAVTQPIFDVNLLERFLNKIRDCRIPIIAGIQPLLSNSAAEFFSNEVPGCSVPAEILARMRNADHALGAKAEGMKIASELVQRVRGMVQGVQIRGPFEEYDTALHILL